MADSFHKPRMTHLPHLSEMGPQTAGAVGGDARRKACSPFSNTASPADAGVSRRSSAEPAAGDSGVRRRCGERGNFPDPVIPESASRLSGTLRRNEASALHSPRFEG